MSNTDNDAEDTVQARRLTSISAHNTRVRWFLTSSLIPFARRAVLYEVHSTRPRLVLVPPNDDWDPACGAYASTQDLDVDALFGEHFHIEPIHQFPGTDWPLTNGYDIVGSADMASDTEHPNLAIRRLFNVGWIGNVLVVKRGRNDRSRTVNITQSEISLVNALVHCWLRLNTEDPSERRE